ncbi:MAG: hypothetical protein GF331_26345 [Chitinivibrionales bacterium]|nr:hypothetical protein [Chitinivibrionales bacterium]
MLVIILLLLGGLTATAWSSPHSVEPEELLGLDSVAVAELVDASKADSCCEACLRLAKVSESVTVSLTRAADIAAEATSKQIRSDSFYLSYPPFTRMVSWGLDLDWSHLGQHYSCSGRYYRSAETGCREGTTRLYASYKAAVFAWPSCEGDTSCLLRRIAYLDSLLTSGPSPSASYEISEMKGFVASELASSLRTAGDQAGAKRYLILAHEIAGRLMARSDGTTQQAKTSRCSELYFRVTRELERLGAEDE